ncbi:MAG: TIGR03986 family CRISPR-associated RAMP protein [Acidobacteriota bacterium]
MSRGGGEVHNPYHFVPAKGGERGRVPVGELRPGGLPRLGHERYVEGAYSGRLLCRLTTETPTFVGNKRTREATREQAGRVEPFELEPGEPALPASSLRGLVGSVAEAASDSALRVLSDRSLSFRRPAKEGLSAIGMVVEGEDEEGRGRLELRPLALPMLQTPKGQPAELRPEFVTMFGRFPPQLKIYCGNYDEIRNESQFPYRTYRRDREVFYGLKLFPRQWDKTGRSPVVDDDPHQHRKVVGKKKDQEVVLAQKAIDGAAPRRWDQIPEDERPRYTRCIARVLGCWGRDDIPDNKRHELLLPYPEDVEERPTFPIPESVLATFHRAADERTADRDPESGQEPLPYEPKDTDRNRLPDPDDRRFRLKPGDLVYFEPTENGREVAWLSLSSIWRSVPRKGSAPDSGAATAHVFFETLDPELLPFHEGRQTLTHAEQLLGFVTRGRRLDPKSPAAFKGRLRFSFGRLEAGQEEPFYRNSCTLRVLASPKPPAPELYFKDRQAFDRAGERGEEPTGSFLGVEDLNAQRHAPQGRKMYLHQVGAQGAEPWRTEPEHEDDLLQMKTEVAPMRRGLSFLFHVDVDNLDEDDLALLCYALRPTEGFRHKLGMGKPLGLGTVAIEPVGLFLVDRKARYAPEGFFGPRYASAWIPSGEDAAAWPERYRRERRAAESPPAGGEAGAPQAPDPAQLATSYREAMDPDIRQALELVGETLSPERPVATPQVAGEDREKETYRWFVDNRRRKGQGLAPLGRGSRRLPVLDEPPEQRGS